MEDTALGRIFAGQLAPLDQAALDIARIEYPDLDPQPVLDLLDQFADEIQRRVNQGRGEFLDVALDYLFGELEFRGNSADYYNPRNSCLNTVVEMRTGIPITLAVVYMEVARRAGEDVRGISLPGHFVAEYRRHGFSVYVDAFSGRCLSRSECRELVREVAGIEIPEDHPSFAPAPPPHILVRMLNNLRAIYFQRRAWAKLLDVLNWLCLADPKSGDWLRQRAVTFSELKRYGAARQDLRRYLALFPEADDKEQVEGQIRLLSRMIAGAN